MLYLTEGQTKVFFLRCLKKLKTDSARAGIHHQLVQKDYEHLNTGETPAKAGTTL
jgi:hypothetical protein